MFASLFVGSVIKMGAKSFTSVTGKMVQRKHLKQVERDAVNNGGELNHVEEPLDLTDAEIEELLKCPAYVAGVRRAAAAAAGKVKAE